VFCPSEKCHSSALKRRSATAGPARAGPRYAPLGGDPLRPYSGATPSLGGTGSRPLRDPAGSHRAPPRGVDVKQPLRTGSPRPQRGRKPQKTAFLAKNDQNRDFTPYFAKMGLLGPFCRFRPRFREGFYINPSRRGPVPRFWGILGSRPGRGWGGPFWAFFSGNPLFGGFGTRGPGGP